MPKLNSLVVFVLLSIISLTSLTSFARTLRYCVPVPRIDFNPFRKINDGRELTYLTLLRSYISSVSEEPGLLAAYEFSPDGKEFTGRLAAGLSWSDGSAVTAHQMLNGIVQALPYRPLGKRVRVIASEVIDSQTFHIKFVSDIKNLTGVFREAISTNSRHNRFWPIKGDSRHPDKTLFLAKFPQTGKNEFSVKDHKVVVVPAVDCSGADFSLFSDSLRVPPSQYAVSKSPAESSIFIEFDTRRLNREQRSAFLVMVRSQFAAATSTTGLRAINSFFLPGEPGYQPDFSWPTSPKFDSKPFRMTLGYSIPLFEEVLRNSPAVKQGRIRLVQLPTTEALDAQILASGIQNGRHVIFQDILEWESVKGFLGHAPHTRLQLKKIAEMSASTVPPDNTTLQDFENFARTEVSIAPVARRNPLAFSKKSLPLRVDFNPMGEVTFRSVVNP